MYTLSQQLQAEAKKISHRLYKDGELDLLALCQDWGIQVFNAHFNEPHCSDSLVYRDHKWIIYINQHDSHQRQRFTLAHALGHYFLYHNTLNGRKVPQKHYSIQDIAITKDIYNSCPLAERHANQFASMILMPEPAMQTLYESGKSVEEMAQYFGVTESAMTCRLLESGYRLLESCSY